MQWYSCYRYDPIGVGKSTINDLTVQVEDWLDSALAMVDNICDKDVPIIIVSSSVGSWVRFYVMRCTLGILISFYYIDKHIF